MANAPLSIAKSTFEESELADRDRRYFIIFNSRNREMKDLILEVMGHNRLRIEELNGFHTDAHREFHRDLLQAERNGRLQPSVLGVGIRIVRHVDRVTGRRFPAEHLDQAWAVHERH